MMSYAKLEGIKQVSYVALKPLVRIWLAEGMLEPRLVELLEKMLVMMICDYGDDDDDDDD